MELVNRSHRFAYCRPKLQSEIAQARHDGFKPFAYCWNNAQTGKTGTDTVWCWSEKDFQELLAEWNAIAQLTAGGWSFVSCT